PTGAQTIDFGLIFDEPVQGLDASDFDVGGTSHGWDVTDVRGGPEGYTIEVSADHPDEGTLQLELAAGGVTGLANPVAAAVEYAHDVDSPSVVLYREPHSTYVRDASLWYFNVTATFSEPVIGFGTGDVQLGGTSQTQDAWTVPEIFGEPGGATYGLSVENHGWRNGTLTFQIPDGAVTDLAGNPVHASNLVSVILDSGRPTTSAPRASLRAGTTLPSGSQALVVTWSGQDAGPSGIASYDVARSVDGSLFRLLTAGLSGPSTVTRVLSGHAYRFEVRARDRAGNVGAWVAGPTLRPSVLQQTAGAVRWSGSSKTVAGKA